MNCTWTKCCTVSNLQNSPVFMCSLQVMLTGYVRLFNHWCKNPKEVSAEMRDYPVLNNNKKRIFLVHKKLIRNNLAFREATTTNRPVKTMKEFQSGFWNNIAGSNYV